MIKFVKHWTRERPVLRCSSLACRVLVWWGTTSSTRDIFKADKPLAYCLHTERLTKPARTCPEKMRYREISNQQMILFGGRYTRYSGLRCIALNLGYRRDKRFELGPKTLSKEKYDMSNYRSANETPNGA